MFPPIFSESDSADVRLFLSECSTLCSAEIYGSFCCVVASFSADEICVFEDVVIHPSPNINHRTESSG